MIIKDESYFEKKFYCYMGGGDGDGGGEGTDSEADGPVGSGLGPGDTATTGGGNMSGGSEADGPPGSGLGPNDVATVSGGNRAATSTEMSDFSTDNNNNFFGYTIGPETTNMPPDLAKQMNVDLGLAFNTGLPAPVDQFGYQSLAVGTLASALSPVPGLGTMVGLMADDTMRGQNFAGGYGNMTAGGMDDGTRGFDYGNDVFGSDGGNGTTPFIASAQPTPTTPAPVTEEDVYRPIFGEGDFTAADISDVLSQTNYPLYLELIRKQNNNPFTRPTVAGTDPFMRTDQTG